MEFHLYFSHIQGINFFSLTAASISTNKQHKSPLNKKLEIKKHVLN